MINNDMPTIATKRLNLKPTDKVSWSIHDRIDNQMIGELFFRDQWFNVFLKSQSRGLGVATEASYGLMKTIDNNTYQAKTELPDVQAFLNQMGFISNGDYYEVSNETLRCPNPYHQLNQELHINTAALLTAYQPTASQLVDAGIDCFNRPCKLHPQANSAWQKMQTAAQKDGINLALISGYRSMAYQAKLIEKKLNKGLELSEVLTTNTAPGHSEHHTGCAIDVTSTGYEPLSETFDQSPAFSWLTAHARDFGFVMSFAKENKLGIIYEPWHWCYHHGQ